MIISQSDTGMSMRHNRSEETRQQERIERVLVDGSGRIQQRWVSQSDSVSLSSQAISLAKQVEQQDPALRQQMRERDNADDSEAQDRTIKLDIFKSSLTTLSVETSFRKSLLEALFGVDLSSVTGESFLEALNNLKNEAEPVSVGERVGMRYSVSQQYTESESMAFSAQGVVVTADGQRLAIDIQLEMARSFSSSNRLEMRAGYQVQDPLVINFAGNAIELTDDKFGFDLDADGDEEQISFVGPGSGMLTLDRNGDGQVNDGSELFGAMTGDGFAELASYDEDGNGFIDEGDSVYSELRIWVKNADGVDQQFALADKGVGAIYLGAVQTPFEIKDQNNQLQGVVRSSSFFVGEEGESGTVQQVDLVV
ncbi:hypothetical protein [Marinobacterium arenosum]|uniref:hypothetical protein n=1 Tax=Marinobacterium arenosum TaxID=2862496 RepID=UPI001C94C424|nr:hypothetical protein [Marinobacterium arenosum]MBY4678933.1 hypothetical protein [Marinobacterium arenosum]